MYNLLTDFLCYLYIGEIMYKFIQYTYKCLYHWKLGLTYVPTANSYEEWPVQPGGHETAILPHGHSSESLPQCWSITRRHSSPATLRSPCLGANLRSLEDSISSGQMGYDWTKGLAGNLLSQTTLRIWWKQSLVTRLIQFQSICQTPTTTL